MSATFTTRVLAMRTASEDGLTQVVKEVDFLIEGEDTGQTFGFQNTMVAGPIDQQNFVPFADLTEQHVIDWIEAEPRLVEVKAHIQLVLDKMVASAALTPETLPWAPPPVEQPPVDIQPYVDPDGEVPPAQ